MYSRKSGKCDRNSGIPVIRRYTDLLHGSEDLLQLICCRCDFTHFSADWLADRVKFNGLEAFWLARGRESTRFWRLWLISSAAPRGISSSLLQRASILRSTDTEIPKLKLTLVCLIRCIPVVSNTLTGSTLRSRYHRSWPYTSNYFFRGSPRRSSMPRLLFRYTSHVWAGIHHAAGEKALFWISKPG